MTSPKKTLEKILRGGSEANLRFGDLRTLLRSLGVEERIKGSHHIFDHEDVDEILNLQPVGSKAKPYQVRDVRDIILNYGLVSHEDE
jgi:predicted RNA binding protein YcfA (HicA-like mRNA interferase family)